MKKYEILEQFMKQNKDKWYNSKEINQYVKISMDYLRGLARAGFLLVTKVNEPNQVNYYRYNENAGKWGRVTTFMKNGK